MTLENKIDWEEVAERHRQEANRVMWDMASPNPRKTRPLIVMGRPSDVEAVQPYLPPAGFRSASVATTIEQLEERLPHYPDAPILIAESADNSQFATMARAVVDMVGTGRQILHPAFLANHLPVYLPNAVVTYGYAGAGNVILQRIIRDIAMTSPFGHSFNLIRSWCSGGHALVCDAISSACKKLDASEIHIGYGDVGSVNCLIRFKDIQSGLMFPHVPSPIYVAERVYGTHSIPTAESIERILDSGAKVAFLLRHPLDVLVAIAGKYTVMTANENGAQPPKGAERQEGIRQALDTSLVFETAVLGQRNLLRCAARFKHSALIARYEDLMADPTGEIARLAECLGLTPSHEAVAAMADLVGTTELGPAGHMVQPGVGKWRGAIPPHRLAQAQGLGLMEAGAPFGYTADTTDAEAAPLSESVSSYIALYCMADPEMRRAVEATYPVTKAGGIEVFGFDEPAVARWRGHVDADPYLQQIMHCLALRQP